MQTPSRPVQNGANGPLSVRVANANLHLWFSIDTTGSMGSYLASMPKTLNEIFSIAKILFRGNLRIHLVTYEDYCDGTRLLRHCHSTDEKEIRAFAAALRAGGGGDRPEALKTALNHIAEEIRKLPTEHDHFVFTYADAPPHHARWSSSAGKGSNINREMEALKRKDPGFDWLKICRWFADKNVPFVSFVPQRMQTAEIGFFSLLGDVLLLPSVDSASVTKATVMALSMLLGEKPEKETGGDAGLKGLQSLVSNQAMSKLHNEGALTKDVDFNRLVQTGPFDLDPLPFELAINNLTDGTQKEKGGLRALPRLLGSDEDFRSLVFEEFNRLLTPDSVLALTYNPLLGSIWRALCKCREDDRLAPLVDHLSSCVQALPADGQRESLQAWIELSYDKSAEIGEAIRNASLSEGVLVLEMPPNAEIPTRTELRSVAQKPDPGALSKLQKALTHLVVVPGEAAERRGVEGLPKREEDDVPLYLPLSLKDKDLFGYLGHLLHPGTEFSLRPAMMLAILALTSGNQLLSTRAERLLTAWKGAWIPPLEKAETYPEILTVDFIHLVCRIPELLTEDEKNLYSRLRAFHRLRRSAPLKFSLTRGFTPVKEVRKPDHKAECKMCKYQRSVTLMVGDTCGICLSEGSYVGELTQEWDATRSHFVQCRTCTGTYAVVRPNQLNVTPKCHYCRYCQTPPLLQCSCCLNQWVVPNKDVVNKTTEEKWECAVCTEALERCGESGRVSEVTESVSVSLETLAGEGALCSGLPAMFGFVPSRSLLSSLFNTISIFKVATQERSADALFAGQENEKNAQLFASLAASAKRRQVLPDSAETPDGPPDHQAAETETVPSHISALQADGTLPRSLTYQGKSIHGVSSLLAEIWNRVRSAALSDVCDLCCEPKALTALSSACGKAGCSALCCDPCLNSWYGQMQPGEQVMPSHLACPFCKTRPKTETLRKHNRRAVHLFARDVIKRVCEGAGGDFIWGWCQGCSSVREVAARECARGVGEVKDFRCEDCVLKQKEAANDMNTNWEGRKCPGCQTPCVKISGCDHMTCVCGAHFCWVCLWMVGGEDAGDVADVYEHIDLVHGWGDGEDDGEE